MNEHGTTIAAIALIVMIATASFNIVIGNPWDRFFIAIYTGVVLVILLTLMYWHNAKKATG